MEPIIPSQPTQPPQGGDTIAPQPGAVSGASDVAQPQPQSVTSGMPGAQVTNDVAASVSTATTVATPGINEQLQQNQTPQSTQYGAPLGSGAVSSAPSAVGSMSAGLGGAATVPPSSKKKWLIPSIAGGALLVLLSTGYVFGMYLPNRPEAVFKSSMSRSGAAADKLIEYSQTLDKTGYTGAAMDGTLAVKSSALSFDATMQGKTDGTNSEMTVAANIAGEKMDVDLRMLDSATSDSPDLYLKVSGVKQILGSSGGSQLASLDGQWIAVDHTLLDTYKKQLESSAGASADLGVAPTAEQINDASAKVQAVNKMYLFTSDEAKSVVAYKSFVGKETVDGRSVNHYTTTANKTNLKAYIEALGKALDSSKLDTWSTAQNDGKHISELLDTKSIKDSVDDIGDNETFDMYVDAKTKLVQSVTFTDKTEGNSGTLTFAQNYTGGDTYPFSVRVKSADAADNMDITLGMSLNTKTNAVDMALKGDTGDINMDMKAKITPNKEKVTVQAPSGAKPVTQVMKQLGLDQSVLGAQTSVPSSLFDLNKL